MLAKLGMDDRLVEDARELGRHRSKKEAVNAALEEYIRRRKQPEIARLFGTIQYDPAYNYRAERRRRG